MALIAFLGINLALLLQIPDKILHVCDPDEPLPRIKIESSKVRFY